MPPPTFHCSRCMALVGHMSANDLGSAPTPSFTTYLAHPVRYTDDMCLQSRVRARTKNAKVSLWRLPTPDPNDEPLHEHVMGGERGFPLAPLGEPLAEFGGLKSAATAMLWSPPGGATSAQGRGGGFVSLADGQLRQWNVGDGRWAWTVEFGVETDTSVLGVSMRSAVLGHLPLPRLFAWSSTQERSSCDG